MLKQGYYLEPKLFTDSPITTPKFIQSSYSSITTPKFIQSSYMASIFNNVINSLRDYRRVPQISRVIFNNPATVVIWDDGTKTVVKVQGKEKYDKEKGLALCISKKAIGNTGNYYEEFKKWIK